jgi:AraC family transcriptional regulator
LTCTAKTEGVWSGGLICGAIFHNEGADGALEFSQDQHALRLTLSGGSEVTRVKTSGFPTYEGRDRAGCVSFTAADVERRGWYRDIRADLCVLLIDRAFIRSWEFDADALDLPSFTNTRDPLLENVVWSMAREMGDDAAGLPSLYAEHAAGLIMAHLIRSVRRRSWQLSRPGLSETDLRRVTEFIEENLGQDISLIALAALTGKGVDAFARNFKARMGIPPYRYVLERRIRRAQELLSATDKSIAEIAFEVGFSSQAHFTTQFSKVMNMSPASYRLVGRG